MDQVELLEQVALVEKWQVRNGLFCFLWYNDVKQENNYE